MKLICLLAVGSLLLGAGPGVSAGSLATDPVVKALSHTNTFAVYRYVWRDEKRQREVPVTIYCPNATFRAGPMILFSHGLGGSRDGYDYLGRYWAAHGLVSVHVQHLGSDTAIWSDVLTDGLQGAMWRSVRDVQNSINRPLDVSFAITRMLQLNRDKQSPFFGRVDPASIGVAGHSFGAFTTLAIAGQTFPPAGGSTGFFGDPRVKAAIPMSASIPTDRRDLDATYDRVRIPCFHMTGTLDDSPLGETMAAQRRVPFDHCRHSDQFLVTFNGADHMTFAGLNNPWLSGAQDPEFQRWICISSTVFWNAYLRGDQHSRAWLERDFQTELGTVGKVEVKLKP